MMAVYQIRNLATGHIYIGASANCFGRIDAHRRALRGGYHTLSRLQADWATHGEDAFAFDVIETFARADDMIERERLLLTEWFRERPGLLYNRALRVGSRNSHNVFPGSGHEPRIGCDPDEITYGSETTHSDPHDAPEDKP